MGFVIMIIFLLSILRQELIKLIIYKDITIHNIINGTCFICIYKFCNFVYLFLPRVNGL
jgi:hypothetical protein